MKIVQNDKELSSTIYSCPSCSLVVAREDPRVDKPSVFVALSGAKMIIRPDDAPRVRCRCGQLTLLLKGSLS